MAAGVNVGHGDTLHLENGDGLLQVLLTASVWPDNADADAVICAGRAGRSKLNL
jgi:hypothetical protein